MLSAYNEEMIEKQRLCLSRKSLYCLSFEALFVNGRGHEWTKTDLMDRMDFPFDGQNGQFLQD